MAHDDKVKIIGIDNMNDYYDVRLKEVRLEEQSAVIPTITA